MKIALCFIINYDHILNKEHIWREWIEPNKDIINVYFYYKDLNKIKSRWILQHTIPPTYIHETNYYHVIPAYLSLMSYACCNDSLNKWFCILTDSCCPIISPKRFRYLFYKHHTHSLFSWKPAWWNPYFHKRGNLSNLPKELWLGHDPWFILTRENVKQIIHFVNTQPSITNTISNSELANETLFAVIFHLCKELDPNNTKSHIICSSTHIVDWSRQSTKTSPHIFKHSNDQDILFISKELERSKLSIFIRKVDPLFSDTILREFIYEYNKDLDDTLVMIMPFEMMYNKCVFIIKNGCYIVAFLLFLFVVYAIFYNALYHFHF
jgi:hypothetical protein